MTHKELRLTSEQRLSQALEYKPVVDFVFNIFRDSYQRHFPSHKDEVVSMLKNSFDLLLEPSIWKNKKKLHNTVSLICHTIFKKKVRAFWFNKIYQTYKKNFKPELEYRQIKSYIRGNSILDFGCGTGYLALRLKKDNYSVYTTDILNYLKKDVKKARIPFNKMTLPTKINFDDNSIDTITVKAVLHHIDKNNLHEVIKELHRILKKRLIIEESVYNLTLDKQVKELLKKQKPLKAFLSLSPPHQFLALLLIDFFTNALAFGKPQMNFPFEFKTIYEWKKILKSHGFSIIKVEVLGFEKKRITPDCRALIICEKK